ncbi:hypothetical protein HDU86_005095 [Geranomyces michiganensis]|nr:hypothetical protein HDU86_005095 [Geranomyces michiganensis]
MKVTIKKWKAVAAWKWEVGGVGDDETCGICYNAFDGCCPDCKVPGDDCPLVWGQCNHVFHMHCIERWISKEQSREQCPMDRRPWRIRSD